MVLHNALRSAARGVSSSARASMALPALATPTAPKPSFLTTLFGGSAKTLPPMDQPMTGLTIPDVGSWPDLTCTWLPNIPTTFVDSAGDAGAFRRNISTAQRDHQ
jgi:hypothetical protein